MPETAVRTGPKSPAPAELVRLAIPRRVYTRNHLAYVAVAVTYVAQRGRAISGMRLTAQPDAMRHFTARFARCRLLVCHPLIPTPVFHCLPVICSCTIAGGS